MNEHKEGRIARYKGDGPFLLWNLFIDEITNFLIPITRETKSSNFQQYPLNSYKLEYEEQMKEEVRLNDLIRKNLAKLEVKEHRP